MVLIQNPSPSPGCGAIGKHIASFRSHRALVSTFVGLLNSASESPSVIVYSPVHETLRVLHHDRDISCDNIMLDCKETRTSVQGHARGLLTGYDHTAFLSDYQTIT